MTNIIITYKCNLKCCYCFANEFVNKTSKNITFEDFIKAYYFIRRNERDRIGIIGGEPTLHPEFGRMIEFLNGENRKQKFKIPVQIYTNGIEIDKYIGILKKGNYHLLINCNSPKVIGETSYKKLLDNLRLIDKNFKKKYVVGINLFSETMDYEYIFEILKEFKLKTLRFSLTVPNLAEKKHLSREEAFGKKKEFLFKVFEKCRENGISPFYDCNIFLSCLTNPEDLKFLKTFKERYNLIKYSSCNPVIDILPDLKAIRCFGMSDYMKVSINDFKNTEELRKFFEEEIDHYAKKIPTFEECRGCEEMMLGNCYGGCLAYKADRIEEYKQHCKQFFNKV